MILLMASECTAVGCYLEQHGGVVSFPLVTLAGLADGINPCAIGMMVALLGYLIVFGAQTGKFSNSKKSKSQTNSKSPSTIRYGAGKIQNSQTPDKKILQLGLVYIGTVFVTYLLIGLVFYSLVFQIQQVVQAGIINRVIGTVLGLAGLIMLKDVVWPESPVHLRIPGASKEKLMGLIEKVSVPTTILLGVAVTVLETPCSLPLYAGTATVLANSGLALPIVIGYFLYYNFLFVLPLIIVLIVVWQGKRIVEMKEWEHKAERWMKLSLGTLLLALSGWLWLS